MKALLCTLLFVVAFPLFVRGQTADGTIRGSVTDPSGAAVPGMSITARNVATGLAVTVKTTDAGLYNISNLPPGTYSVTAEGGSGFKKFEQNGVTVQTSTTTDLNITLQLGEVSQTVTVNANAQQLETSTSDVGTTVQTSLVNNLPLEVSGVPRNPVQFITLVPGFVGQVGNNPANNATDDYKLNGGQEGGTDILVDGLTISLVSPNTQQNKGISPEAVEEFTTLQSNFSAEYGQAGDSIVSLTMKSGTNNLHGDVYEFLRNSALDANSWTNNTAGAPKNLDHQSDFGGIISGPVYLPKIYNGKDKTFFMFAFEGFRYNQGSSSATAYPPSNFLQGNFSALCTTNGATFSAQGICSNLNYQIYDPTTQTAVPNNTLSSDPNYKASAVMSKVFSYLPPTSSAGVSSNVLVVSTTKIPANMFDIKIDQNVTSEQRFSFGLDYDNTNNKTVESIGPIYGGATPQNTRYVRFSHDYTLTSSLLNHFLIGLDRRYRGEISNGLGGGYPAKLGLTGVNNNTFPCFDFEGTPYDQVLSNCGDSEFADNTVQVADAVSWIHGKHSLKFGGELRDMEFNVRRLTYGAGEFYFSPAQTSSTGNSSGMGGNAIASALFGDVYQGYLVYGNFSGIRYKNSDIYAQDSYKATSKLTLNYGLRWDIDIPASEAFDRFADIDPTLANPGAGNIPGAYVYFGNGPGRNGQTRPQNTYFKDFGPRLGFAYSIDNKTVVRGGYGIFYEPLREPSFADQDALGFFNNETITTPFEIDSGIPHIVPPSGPLTPQGQNGNAGVIMIPANSGRPGDIQSWNLDVQRQIGTNLLLDVAYVGSKGSHLPALNIIPNQVNPEYLSLGNELGMNVSCLTNGSCPNSIAAGVKAPFSNFSTLWGGSATIAQALRPFPQYGNFTQDDNSFGPDKTGNSTYHSMQARLTKRFSSGLSALVAYTISKNITDADSMGAGVSGFIGTGSYIGQNSYDRRAEKAVSELDTPQSLVASFFYELPTGHGKRYLSHAGAADRVVSGWNVSAILNYSSGWPTEPGSPCAGTGAGILFGGCNVTGADGRLIVLPGPQTNKSGTFQPASTSFYNAAAFAIPSISQLGNEPPALDHARAWGNKNEDFVLEKRTRLGGEKADIKFRAEFFNLFNRHIYQLPAGQGFATTLATPFAPAYSPACGVSSPFSCGFGAITSASGPRNIQLGLKIDY
jgi:hypothetical protein